MGRRSCVVSWQTTIRTLGLLSVCVFAGCYDPVRQVDAEGTITHGFQASDVLLMAAGCITSIVVAAVLLRVMKMNRGWVVAALVIGVWMLATVPSQFVMGVRISDTDLDWTGVSWTIPWSRHVDWAEVEQITVHESVRVSGRGARTVTTTLRFSNRNGEDTEWNVYMGYWREAFDDVLEKAQELEIPVVRTTEE